MTKCVVAVSFLENACQRLKGGFVVVATKLSIHSLPRYFPLQTSFFNHRHDTLRYPWVQVFLFHVSPFFWLHPYIPLHHPLPQMATTEDSITSFPPSSPSRLLLVSNRLPISITYQTEEDTYKFSPGSGGLITGLSGLSKATRFQWYGWTGLEVPEAAKGALAERLKVECDAVPVFLDGEVADLYYNKFASGYFPTQPISLCGYTENGGN